MEHVILVNTNDEQVGTMEKMEAHQRGLLHRAFSVILFNSNGEMMLQKRAKHKYHSGGLWTNACCSHPRENESVDQAANRRLIEEMGIDIQPEFLYKFIYRAQLDKNLIEHELDHVYTAVYDHPPTLNSDEVENWKFSPVENIRKDIADHPERYTEWFKIIMDSYENHLTSVRS